VAAAAKAAADEFDIPLEPPLPEEPSIEDEGMLLAPEPAPAEPEMRAFDNELEKGDGIRTAFLEEEPGGFDLEAAPPPAPVVPVELRARAAAAGPPAARDVPADLARGLEEIESYVSMGFVDDAKVVLQDLVSRFGSHRALVERVAGLGLELPGAAAPAARPPRPSAVAPEPEFDVGLIAPPPPTRRPSPPPAPRAPGRTARPEPQAATEEPLSLGADLFADISSPAAETGFDLGGEPPPPPDEEPAAPEEHPGGFDLASELGDLFSAQPAVADEPPVAPGTDFGDDALADIFREFQKGVDKQLGKEDYETRYNLGIAYKEMGLVDEAIAEFQLAAKDESRLLECSSMLGICFIEKGMPKLAVKWFEKGLSAPGRTEDEYQALRYDLANALEQSGEVDRARGLFTELYGQDANFRDVADRVRQLGASR
jgi:hypothetical protein